MALSSLYAAEVHQPAQAAIRAESAQTGTSNTEMLARQASEAASQGVFPFEVAVVMLGCLIVSSFLLLARESRIENSQR